MTKAIWGHFLKRFWPVLVVVSAIVGLFLISVNPVNAASGYDPSQNGYVQFQDDEISGSGSSIIKSTQNLPYLFKFYQNKDADNSAMQYVWSTANTFNLNRVEVMGFWVKVPTYNKKLKDDGMAFVLAESNSQKLTKSSEGETLGVYANPANNFKADTNAAIQKSLAIEFDDYKNDGGGDYSESNSEYDYKIGNSGAHVAWAYPADSDTYYKTDGSSWFKYRLGMYHNGNGNNIATDLPSGQWVHVTIKYNGDISNPELTYTVGDKSNATGEAQAGIATTIKLDKNKLGNADKLYWGFTSANAATSSDNANQAVLDQYSESFLPNAELKVNGRSTYDSVVDSTDSSKTTQSVSSGDSLQYNMSLNGIRQELISGATASGTLPTGLRFVQVDGSYGKITYADGTTTKTQELTAADVADGKLNVKLSDDFQNSLKSVDDVVTGDLNVELNVATSAAAATTTDGFSVLIKGDSVNRTLTGPKLNIAANTASVSVLNASGKTLFPTGNTTTADGSANSFEAQSGASMTYQYKLENINSDTLAGSSIAVADPDDLGFDVDSDGNVGTVTYTSANGKTTNTQKITAASKGNVLLDSDTLLKGIADGDAGTITVTLKHKSLSTKGEGSQIASETVTINNNGSAIQTFKSPGWKIAPNISSSASLTVQDLNYQGSVTPDKDTHKAQLQDTLRYTYTLTYDTTNSVDKQWRDVVLTPQLVQPGNQYYLEMRNVTVNGVNVATSNGNMPTDFSVKLGTLDAKDADADGKVTVTVVIDCELGYLQSGITEMPQTTATFAGTGDSGNHEQSVTNPSYGVEAGGGLFYASWNRLAMYNSTGVPSDSIDISTTNPDGTYTLKKDDGYAVLQGWTGGGNLAASDIDQYVEINGKQVKGPIALTNSSWNYAFTRDGYAGKIDHSNDSVATNVVTDIGGLQPGVNDIKIYAVNRKTGRRALAGGNSTQHYPYIEFQIIDPAPSLQVDNDIHFQNTTLTGTSEYAPSDEDSTNPFTLKVMYADSTTYNWTVSAATSKFVNDGNALRGELIYQKNGKSISLSDATTPLYSSKSGEGDATQITSSDTDSDGTYNISNTWTHGDFDDATSTGLYMHVFPDAVADEGSSNYQGTITWTFSSTPTSSDN